MIKDKVNNLRIGDYISLTNNSFLMKVVNLEGYSTDKDYTYIEVEHFRSLYLKQSSYKKIKLNNSKVVFRFCRDIKELKQEMAPIKDNLILYKKSHPLSPLMVPLTYIPFNLNKEPIKASSDILHLLCSRGWFPSNRKVRYKGIDFLIFKYIKHYINSYCREAFDSNLSIYDNNLSPLHLP